jgi:hypothetical protein
VSALLLVGDAFCAGAAASDADAVQLTSRAVGMLSFLAMPDIQRMQLGHYRHDEAEDACLRCLALLTPPHTFWARGLTCLTHAAWRDAPLGANDVRITLAPAVAHAVASQEGMLSGAHRGLATVYTFAQRRPAEAHACLLRALAAVAAEPPGPARQRRRAQVYLDCGNLVGRCEIGGADWQVEARACWQTVLQLADGTDGAASAAGEDAAEWAQMRMLARASLDALAQKVAAAAAGEGAAQRTDAQRDAELASYESRWPHGSAGCTPETSEMVLCNCALRCTDTAAAQRPWLLRVVAHSHAPAALKMNAMRCCRACGAPAAACELKLCAGCRRVAFCSAACQKADWRSRHKRWCAATTPEAALADVTCPFCQLGVAAELSADAAAEAEAQPPDLWVLPTMLCLHLAHKACLLGRACPVCAHAAVGAHTTA